MADAMMCTSDLLDELTYFRMQLSQRIGRLRSATLDAEETIKDMERAKVAAKVHIVQQGGMVPPDDHFGDWEYDSEDGEGRGITQLGNIDAGMFNYISTDGVQLTKILVIKEQRAKIVEIDQEINVEACMDNMLRIDMNEFAVAVQMVGVELERWRRGDITRCLYTNTPMHEAWKQMGEYIVKKLWQSMAEEEAEQEREAEQVKQAIAMIKKAESAAVASSKKYPSIPRCFTCKELGHIDRECGKVDVKEETGLNDPGRYAHLDRRSAANTKPWEKKSKFCITCSKPGHTERYCHITHREEEKGNYCDHCGKYGHRINGCFGLHPDLLQEF
ncbi:hypothetical protein ONS95_001385 [Cadophora gregata]|uniref:uncharacterized protein n=1 Tax=Cadophora gregata TaxID=51156 RepID=UPI0026DBBBA7|nr:uncharacterized protein ONS95_001385 [Cadophora gregata]KAK0111005.1 hypothetical protein ONS95_001385 [Cadophora gregata]KAK0112537.1 hypothetical protein ONS96_001773 [Cadophora gregata f. sp. sojae]